MKTGARARVLVVAISLASRAALADDPAVVRAEPDAGGARAVTVEKRPPRLTVRLAAGSPAGAEVARDGTVLGGISLGIALPVDPGAHTLVVRAPGHADASTLVTLREGEDREVVVTAGPEASAAPIAPARATSEVAPQSPERRGLGVQREIAIVALAAGGASLLVGTVSGVSALLSWGNAESACNKGCSATSPAEGDRNAALTASTISDIGFVASGVLVVSGVALWLTSPAGAEGAPKVAIVPGLSGFSLQGAF
jgi:hypothetical protein